MSIPEQQEGDIEFPVGSAVKAGQLLGLRHGFAHPLAPGDLICPGVAAHDASPAADEVEITYVAARRGVFLLAGEDFKMEHVGSFVHGFDAGRVTRLPYGIVDGRSVSFARLGRAVRYFDPNFMWVRVEGV